MNDVILQDKIHQIYFFEFFKTVFGRVRNSIHFSSLLPYLKILLNYYKIKKIKIMKSFRTTHFSFLNKNIISVSISPNYFRNKTFGGIGPPPYRVHRACRISVGKLCKRSLPKPSLPTTELAYHRTCLNRACRI
jgi:hypothetical protein